MFYIGSTSVVQEKTESCWPCCAYVHTAVLSCGPKLVTEETRRFGSATILCSQVLCDCGRMETWGCSCLFVCLQPLVTDNNVFRMNVFSIGIRFCLKVGMSKAGVDRHNVTDEPSDSMNVSSLISLFQIKDILFSALEVAQTTWHRMIGRGRERSWHFEVLWRCFEVLWQYFLSTSAVCWGTMAVCLISCCILRYWGWILRYCGWIFRYCGVSWRYCGCILRYCVGILRYCFGICNHSGCIIMYCGRFEAPLLYFEVLWMNFEVMRRYCEVPWLNFEVLRR